VFHNSLSLPSNTRKDSKRSLATSLRGPAFFVALLFAVAATASAQTAGYIYTYAGNGNAGYVNGLASSAEFNGPEQLGFDGSGNLYVYDSENFAVRLISPSGVVTNAAILAGTGGDGIGAIGAMAVDASGNLYVASYNSVFKITPSGAVTTLATFSGDPDPAGLAVDSAGNVYVGLTNTIVEVTPQGVQSTIAGNGSGDCPTGGGSATGIPVSYVTGMAIDSSDNLYYSMETCSLIYKVNLSTGIASPVAGNGLRGFSGDGGSATAAEINVPRGLAIDSNNNLYVADEYNDRVRVINSAGVINTVAGTGNAAYNGDNILATTADLSSPYGVAVDSQGNVYISDAGNERIRRVYE